LTVGYDELVGAGTSTREAAVLTGLARATQGRRHRPKSVPAQPVSIPPAPVNKLTVLEELQVLAVLNSDRFVDKPPTQVYATLLAEGVYLGSIATMYRILGRNMQVKDRRRQASHPPRAVPELQATAPRQVYSWDITKLAGPARGKYFDCYVMIDIYSRMIVGAHVHHTETAELAKDLMTEVFGIQGVPHVVHADRGTSMTSKTVATLLDDLQVTRSHSRPRVSNDNPYSEAWNKTLKYAPVFPERFSSLSTARAFIGGFVEYYNHHHRHSAIGLHTPADVHYGIAPATARERSQTPGSGPPATPHQVRRHHRSQDPRPPNRGLDQPTTETGGSSSLIFTPTGPNRLDNFRDAPGQRDRNRRRNDGRSAALDRLLEPVEQTRPHALGMLGLFLAGVVVLTQRDVRATSGFGKLVGECVVVLGDVRLAAERTEVAHPEQPVRLDRQDLALVLVFLALVHALPDDRTSLLPVGLHLRAEHVLLDLLRVRQCRPHPAR